MTNKTIMIKYTVSFSYAKSSAPALKIQVTAMGISQAKELATKELLMAYGTYLTAEHHITAVSY